MQKEIQDIEEGLTNLSLRLSSVHKELRNENSVSREAEERGGHLNKGSLLLTCGSKARITHTFTEERNIRKKEKIGVIGTVIDFSKCYVWIQYKDGYIIQRHKDYVEIVSEDE